ncbi:MAG: RnfABCDGE type electron transport complex subunit G [Ruminococcaceae bacterium]|nr:RnfABCDGE type electron transport complex subunit G [Oscillospiraceae bacterium]
MAKSKSNALKNISVLFVVALVSVALLAVLNQVTKDKIAEAETQAKIEVYQSVFESAETIEEIEEYSPEKSSYAPEDESITINAVLEARSKDNEKLGYVFDVTSSEGYGGDVQIAVGITNDGEITAFKVISASETPGLGAKSMEDEYASEFSGLSALENITFVKSDAKSENNEIDAIGGATITTTATTNAVNAAIDMFNNVLKGE